MSVTDFVAANASVEAGHIVFNLPGSETLQIGHYPDPAGIAAFIDLFCLSPCGPPGG